jgi:hypothetical protein
MFACVGLPVRDAQDPNSPKTLIETSMVKSTPGREIHNVEDVQRTSEKTTEQTNRIGLAQ